MGVEHLGGWQAAAASTLDWWREAGVDVLVDEQPRDWLARAAPIVALVPTPPTPDALPGNLAAFLDWRAGEAAPEAGWRGAAIRASGPLDAPMMVLVDCPDPDDRDCLLGGSAGRLFDRMLAAIGLTRAGVHLAAVCAKRPVGGRAPAEAQAELHRLAQHHVRLLGPERLLLMGDGAVRAMLDRPLAAARGAAHSVGHAGGEARAVATFHPRWLLDRPAQKADAWRDLQLLMELR